MSRVTVSLPADLLESLDAAAADAGLKRSQAIHRAARLWLESRRADVVRERISRYYSEHPEERQAGEESEAWAEYQRRRMEREYGDDEW